MDEATERMTHWQARLRRDLAAAAVPGKAAGMQAYMKSAMPYLGTPMPLIRRVTLALAKDHPAADAADLLALATVIWRGAVHREERYAAQLLTGLKPARGEQSFLPLYEEMIVTGAWWDLVDGVTHRLCQLLLAHPGSMTPVLRGWAVDPDLWKRRAAITSQLGAKAATDTALLAANILDNTADKEFFIRKAIGWALREYGKTDPAWVGAFVAAHADRLSPLSRREALKNIPGAGG